MCAWLFSRRRVGVGAWPTRFSTPMSLKAVDGGPRQPKPHVQDVAEEPRPATKPWIPGGTFRPVTPFSLTVSKYIRKL